MIEQIKSYLRNRHWECQEIDDWTLASGFTSPLPSGEDHGFPLYAMIIEDMFGDAYIRLVIVPYIERPAQGYPLSLSESIQHVNHDLSWAKLAMDEDGDMELLLDIRASELDEAQFDTAMQLLADYAGIYFADLSAHLAIAS